MAGFRFAGPMDAIGGWSPAITAMPVLAFVPGPLGLDSLRFVRDDPGGATPLQDQAAPAGHVVIQVTRDGTNAVSGLECVLNIAGSETTVKTDSSGWIVSDDKAAGAVTLRTKSIKDGKLLTLSGTVPQATLTATPASPTRGDTVSVTITSPAGAVHFKVTEWTYDISHTNPDDSFPTTATVTRPATEATGTFDQKWDGTVCVSGTVKGKFITGVELRASGGDAVSETVTALDPVETSLALTVAARSGPSWQSSLVENLEGPLTKAISSFHDTGVHSFLFSGKSIAVTALTAGPNRGCRFVKSCSVTFTSSPLINTLLTQSPASAFMNAQDKAYLETFKVDPTDPNFKHTVRDIPRQYYEIAGGKTAGPTTIKPSEEANFITWALGRAPKQGETFSWVTSNHCIQPADLLAGTRRHEYKHTEISHKANCLKARRALEPVAFAEALVEVPGNRLQLNGQQATHEALFDARLAEITPKASKTHELVSEEETRRSGQLITSLTGEVVGVNSDDQGNVIAAVWNPTTKTVLT